MKPKLLAMAATVGVCLLASIVPAAPPALEALGDLPGGDVFSQAYGVSADGCVVVGTSTSESGSEPFRWCDGIMSGLGQFGADHVQCAYAVSADGSVIVGGFGMPRKLPYEPPPGQDPPRPPTLLEFEWAAPFLWQDGVMTSLGQPSEWWPYWAPLMGEARGISRDGSVVVGGDWRWENGQVTYFSGLVGGEPLSWIKVLGVSADGSTAVGRYMTSPGTIGPSTSYAVMWEDGTVTWLGMLPGGSLNDEAVAASADGSVIVGTTLGHAPPSRLQAFRWEDGVMTGLGGLSDTLPGLYKAMGVSADGLVVVGGAITDITIILLTGEELDDIVTVPMTPFVWTPQSGIQALDAVLTDLGVDLSAWSDLGIATGMSADGTVIVGHGLNADENWVAWRATLPPRLSTSVNNRALGQIHVEPDLPWYPDPNTSVTLSATPDVGMRAEFKHWLVYDPNHPCDANYAVPDANETLMLTMDRYRQVKAVFWAERTLTILQTPILVQLDPEPEALGVSTYEYGTRVTATAEPTGERMEFCYWTVFDPNYPGDANHALLDTNNPLVVTMDADWEISPYLVLHYNVPQDCGSGLGMAMLMTLSALGFYAVGRRRQ
jgi:probable HAF family extracellular repeat protein